VTGQDIDVIVELQTEASATIDLEAGTYPFVCKFHESAGMVGTLVVQPVAA
jgi:plastocyanin